MTKFGEVFKHFEPCWVRDGMQVCAYMCITVGKATVCLHVDLSCDSTFN